MAADSKWLHVNAAEKEKFSALLRRLFLRSSNGGRSYAPNKPQCHGFRTTAYVRSRREKKRDVHWFEQIVMNFAWRQLNYVIGNLEMTVPQAILADKLQLLAPAMFNDQRPSVAPVRAVVRSHGIYLCQKQGDIALYRTCYHCTFRTCRTGRCHIDKEPVQKSC